MKKLRVFLLCVLALFFMPAFAMGAGSSTTLTGDDTYRSGGSGDYTRVLTIVFVADDTDGSVPNLTLNSDTSGIDKPLTGWRIFSVHTDGEHAGSHTGDDDAAILTDATAGWDTDQWVGYTVTNSTDSSSGTITANTKTTVTATLAGGTNNDWETDDTYTIATEPTTDSDLYIYQFGSDILGAQGVDQIDNTTENDFQCELDSVHVEPFIMDDLTVVITQAATATNDAVGVIKLILH